MHFGLLRPEPRRLQRGRAVGVRTSNVKFIASMASSGEFFVSLERVKLVATVRYVSSSRGSYCRRRLRQYLCRFLSDTRRRAVERRLS